MLWIWLIVGTGVGGVVMAALFGRWLWRKAATLLGELGRLADQASAALDLLDRIEFDPAPRAQESSDGHGSLEIVVVSKEPS